MQVYLQSIYVRFAYEGHRVKVKVKFEGQGQFQGLVYNFWMPWPMNLIFGIQVNLHSIYVKFTYEGHKVKVKFQGKC